jgi:GT2 family glycosyltransferase
MVQFSIVTPVHDPPIDLLRRMLTSIRGQSLSDWELCLVDDGSSDPAVRHLLRATAAADDRVLLRQRSQAGGIVAASNDALAMAEGEYIALVDHDDRLEPEALAMVAAALASDEHIDYLYTDEDKIADDGTVFDTFYKPDWSPERLRSQNYCTHLSVLRRRLVAEVGGFRRGYDGSQDHDLILRVTERAQRIHHVPHVLYHWCVTPGSAAGDSHAKPFAREAGRRAVEAHLERVGVRADVEHLPTPGHFRVRRRLPSPPPTVSIVMPTVGTRRPVWGVTRPLVLDAVDSVLTTTIGIRPEVIVVLDPRTPADVRASLAAREVVVLEGTGSFNYSARCNQGVAASSGELVVLLNDDTRVEQPEWLEQLVAFFGEPDVGVVGARLLYADGTLQHGGILLNEQPLHIFHGFAGDDPGPFGLLTIDREVSAVTGACLATRRSLWDELDGLSEDFAVAFNDLDYCLRVRQGGRRIIWSAHSSIYHFESQTRRPDADDDEIALLYERWGPQLHHDPYGNPNFAPCQATWVDRRRASTTYVVREGWRRLTELIRH